MMMMNDCVLCIQKELSSANVDSSIYHDTLVKKSEVFCRD